MQETSESINASMRADLFEFRYFERLWNNYGDDSTAFIMDIYMSPKTFKWGKAWGFIKEDKVFGVHPTHVVELR